MNVKVQAEVVNVFTGKYNLQFPGFTEAHPVNYYPGDIMGADDTVEIRVAVNRQLHSRFELARRMCDIWQREAIEWGMAAFVKNVEENNEVVIYANIPKFRRVCRKAH